MLNAEKYKERIEELGYIFALVKGEIKDCQIVGCESCDFGKTSGCTVKKLKWLLEEYKESILTDEEKIIIKNIIKAFEPFGKELKYITKYSWDFEPKGYYLNFEYENNGNNSEDTFETFNFNEDKFFVGMELDKAYTPEDLGL